jgi:uncharacterized membrane protein YidH (DUF202 family)
MGKVFLALTAAAVALLVAAFALAAFRFEGGRLKAKAIPEVSSSENVTPPPAESLRV